MTLLLLFAVLFLAFVNGANDSFKGVATLYGSGSVRYRTALYWACGTTFLGALASFFLSQKLAVLFSGRGWVPERRLADPMFILAVAVAAALTVQLATRWGLPISTSHALIGGLAGAGIAAAGSEVRFDRLGFEILLPLLASPLLAAGLTLALYFLSRAARRRLGVEPQSCVCVVGETIPAETALPAGGSLVLESSPPPAWFAGDRAGCDRRFPAVFWRLDAKRVLDFGHFLSAGWVGFARGLNDTPKIAALLAADAMPSAYVFAGVASVMAVGGLVESRKMAATLARKITPMNDGQGFAANLVTSAIVSAASMFGLPASTTHVSCGAIFGIGAANGRGRWSTVRQILAAWIGTFPMAAALGLLGFCLLKNVG